MQRYGIAQLVNFTYDYVVSLKLNFMKKKTAKLVLFPSF